MPSGGDVDVADDVSVEAAGAHINHLHRVELDRIRLSRDAVGRGHAERRAAGHRDSRARQRQAAAHGRSKVPLNQKLRLAGRDLDGISDRQGQVRINLEVQSRG